AAADALWAGVPMLSRAGASYAARLGGSLLHAIGLPELVTHSAKSYEDKAVRLAGRAPELARLRRRLAKNRDRAPLFDTPRLVRQLEQLYLQVARGSLRPDDGQASAPPELSLALVSILIPCGDQHSPEQLERTVRAALAQQYGRCEIIVSDSGSGETRRRRLGKLLAAHPQLRYNRAPALADEANLDHSLTLALGSYIAVAPPGELMRPDKISRMMQYYQAYPGIGLVACWRQPVDAAGQPLPGAPLLASDTAVSGESLARMLLTHDGGAGDLLCPPALLLRRDQLGASFGHYQGRRYRALAGVATTLAALAGRECAYLAAPLSAFEAAPPPATPAAQLSDLLSAALERLYLLYEAHTRQHFLTDGRQFKALLSARLGALNALVLQHYSQLADGDPQQNETVQQALRQGYHLLLGQC
ncbi:glycosyltransferase, partial [Duganella sp. FT80W]